MQLKKIILFIIGLKIILLALFSSNYQNQLFIPFIDHFLANFDNPWQFFFSHGGTVEFPYPPLMLYLLSLFYAPFHFSGSDNIILQNFIFKLPHLLSDLLILYILIKLLPGKLKEILVVYFLSPIVIYASFMHSQLDLIPTAVLFASIYLLTTEKIVLSSIVFGLAFSLKFHIIAAFPLIIIYIFKTYREKYKKILLFAGISSGIFVFLILPYLFSPGFKAMVFNHPKQMLIFDVFFKIGNLNIILALFAIGILFARFYAYAKINQDLFYMYLATVFSVFVFFIIPAPAWYLWMLPFLCIFFIKNIGKDKNFLFLYLLFNAAYLLFFILFYIPDFKDLIFYNKELDLKINIEKLRHISFTGLEILLFIIIYAFYKFGIKSNNIYLKKHNYIIGIGGDSGVGKSTVLQDIKSILNEKLLDVEGDGDHKWERGNANWNKFTHLNPKANYLHRQAECLNDLKLGKNVFRSDYNHEKGTFTEPKKIVPREFIIIAGLHPFYLPIMRKIIDLKIFIDTDEKLKKHWKIIRDVENRGYSKEKILDQIKQREEDVQKYINPQKNFADITIRYFTDAEFEIGDKKAKPDIKLEIKLDASISLEKLIVKLEEYGFDFYWDYSDDLKNQVLVVNQDRNLTGLDSIARDCIMNIEEIISKETVWQDGYRGLIQTIIIMILSEKMKEGEVKIEL